jgi:hypothetical protein
MSARPRAILRPSWPDRYRYLKTLDRNGLACRRRQALLDHSAPTPSNDSPVLALQRDVDELFGPPGLRAMREIGAIEPVAGIAEVIHDRALGARGGDILPGSKPAPCSIAFTSILRNAVINRSRSCSASQSSRSVMNRTRRSAVRRSQRHTQRHPVRQAGGREDPPTAHQREIRADRKETAHRGPSRRRNHGVCPLAAGAQDVVRSIRPSARHSSGTGACASRRCRRHR